jgi:hypothetical protein
MPAWVDVWLVCVVCLLCGLLSWLLLHRRRRLRLLSSTWLPGQGRLWNEVVGRP